MKASVSNLHDLRSNLGHNNDFVNVMFSSGYAALITVNLPKWRVGKLSDDITIAKQNIQPDAPLCAFIK